MPKPRIVVVGSCNVDLTTFTDRFPKPGETIFADGFDLGFGGKGANQAVAAGLLGAATHMVGRVGSDLFGEATLRNFKAMGVSTHHVKEAKGVASGVAPIFVDSRGQNRIFVVSGANDRLTRKSVRDAESLIARADMVVLQFEIPLTTVYYTVGLARRLGVPVIVNPAPARAAELRRLASANYLIPNESETEALTGIRVSSLAQAKKAARELIASGFERVILTLGERGCVLARGETCEHIRAFEVDPVDSSGAGDAFIGSFAVFRAQGTADTEAARMANLYAGLSTERVGTQKSFPSPHRFRREWKRRRES